MNREKLEQQFDRLSIWTRDFEEARDYLERYDPKADMVIQRALISAAIIAYARPFSVNKRGTEKRVAETVRLKLGDVLNTEQKVFHEKIISVRNEAVAHSDFERKQTRRVPATARTPTGVRGFLTWSRPFDVLSEITDIEMFVEMVKLLWHECHDRRMQINQHLESGDGIKLFPE